MYKEHYVMLWYFLQWSIIVLKGSCFYFKAYGLTECVSATHISPFDGGKPASCGVLLPNLECKVSPIAESPKTYDKQFSVRCMEFMGDKIH